MGVVARMVGRLRYHKCPVSSGRCSHCDSVAGLAAAEVRSVKRVEKREWRREVSTLEEEDVD